MILNIVIMYCLTLNSVIVHYLHLMNIYQPKNGVAVITTSNRGVGEWVLNIWKRWGVLQGRASRTIDKIGISHSNQSPTP